MAKVLPEASWQRCYVHFLRNALDHLSRSAERTVLQELRWLYDRHDATEARHDLRAWLERWQGKHPRLCRWVEENIVEENIEETFAFYRLPRAHHKHLKSTNLLERLNQELKRRTHVVRIFPDAEVSPADQVGEAVDSSANGLAGKMANCLFKLSLLYIEAIGRNVEHGRFATRSHTRSLPRLLSRSIRSCLVNKRVRCRWRNLLGQDDRGGGGPAVHTAEGNAGPASFPSGMRA